jgi:hypothetical protein
LGEKIMLFSSLAIGGTLDGELNFVLYASSSPEAVSTNQCLREYQLIPISRYIVIDCKLNISTMEKIEYATTV